MGREGVKHVGAGGGEMRSAESEALDSGLALAKFADQISGVEIAAGLARAEEDMHFDVLVEQE
jgi:hypothetical protein